MYLAAIFERKRPTKKARMPETTIVERIMIRCWVVSIWRRFETAAADPVRVFPIA